MLVARIAAARGLALLGSQGLALHWPFCKPPHSMPGFLTVISFLLIGWMITTDGLARMLAQGGATCLVKI